MLVELLVENYAVIERVRIRFHRGLNLLTGETGSGKSIVVDALALVFGGRASAEMVRTGAPSARVSAIFEIPPPARALLASSGIDPEDDEVLVEREVLAGGKSRAFIASRPAAVSLLRDLGPLLGDIHGQHEQQQLFSAAAQRDMLDSFAGTAALVTETGDIYRRWRAFQDELDELNRSAQEKLRLADLWQFQCKEIEAAAPKAGEDAALENERRVLRNVVRLQEHAAAAYASLYDQPESAEAQVRLAIRKLEEIARIDESSSGLASLLQPALISIDEVSRTLRGYLDRLEADPRRLEEIESRLATLERLKRKYGATLEEVLLFLEQVRRDLSTVETAGQRRAGLDRERESLAAAFVTTAEKLTARRREAAVELARRVATELNALAMPKTVLEVRVEPAEWSEYGADRVEFLISPNPGEPPKPLDRIASGGELSRAALALKTCIAPRAIKTTPRTLVFDEVDAGVGGSAAEAVGRRLKRLAASHQVLCVTHLPQIAGFADHHYSVEKRSSRGRTVAAVEELDGPARLREIGRMLSGERITEAALKQAEQLMKLGAG